MRPELIGQLEITHGETALTWELDFLSFLCRTMNMCFCQYLQVANSSSSGRVRDWLNMLYYSEKLTKKTALTGMGNKDTNKPLHKKGNWADKTKCTSARSSRSHLGLIKKLMPSSEPGSVSPLTSSISRTRYGNVAVKYTTCRHTKTTH